MPKVKSEAVTGLMTHNTMTSKKKPLQTMSIMYSPTALWIFEITQININNYQSRSEIVNMQNSNFMDMDKLYSNIAFKLCIQHNYYIT